MWAEYMRDWQEAPLCGNLQLSLSFSQETNRDFRIPPGRVLQKMHAERRSYAHSCWLEQANGIKRDQEGLLEIMQMLLYFQPGL